MTRNSSRLFLSVLLALTIATVAHPAGTIGVRSALQQAERLKEAGLVEEAIQLCDSIHGGMDTLFNHQYNSQIEPMRMEHNALEMKLEADNNYRILMRNIIILALMVCAICLISYIFIHRRNKAVADSEKKMQDAIQRATIAEKSKSMFLSNMTHEIRTPLNAISGFSSLYTSDLSDDERREAASIIEMNSNLLQNLIDDVVDSACSDLREMKFRTVPCDVVKLGRNVTEMLARIKQTEAEMRFETSTQRLTIITDPLRLQQVLVNVLVNATKFCKQGHIVLTIKHDDETRLATFSVTDTGIGIPREKQAGVFKRFERVRENAEGFGLGLSICQFIIEHFGGRIWVDPDYTGGARFVFTLPYDNGKE